MKKFDSRYIIGVFLVLFILIGSVEFILKGHHSFTLNEIYFRVPIVVVGMVEMLPNEKGWGTFCVLFLVFLSDYLLKKNIRSFWVRRNNTYIYTLSNYLRNPFGYFLCQINDKKRLFRTYKKGK
ncbi:hypothetical protein ACIMRZ_000069 [Enterococcus hirae]